MKGRSGGQGLAISDSPIADEDAERGILGALLFYTDPRITLRLLNHVKLKPESFYWEFHGDIFSALVTLARDEIGGDAVTVNAEMERVGKSTEATRSLLQALPSYVPPGGNYVQYGERVANVAHWRQRRRIALEMLKAVDVRSEEDWNQAARIFLPDPEPVEDVGPGGPQTLRLVDEQGSVVGEQVHCAKCDALEDQLAGANKDVSAWRARHAALERNKDAAARSNAWWLPAQALFEVWKTKTGHKNSKWSTDRFEMAEPHLRAHGVEMFARAIEGLSYNPYENLRKNGTMQKYDSWATLCKNRDAFEEYANRAPKGWKFTLNIAGGKTEDEEERPRLALAATEAS